MAVRKGPRSPRVWQLSRDGGPSPSRDDVIRCHWTEITLHFAVAKCNAISAKRVWPYVMPQQFRLPNFCLGQKKKRISTPTLNFIFKLYRCFLKT